MSNEQITCFLWEGDDHCPSQCPMYSVLISATQRQRENFRDTVRALAKEGNPLSVQELSAEESQKQNVDLSNPPQKRSKPVSSVVCFECRKQGHYAKRCPAKRQVSTFKKDSHSAIVSSEKSQGSTRLCYNCCGKSHYIRQCPRKNQSLTPDARMPEVISAKIVTPRAGGKAVGSMCPKKQSKKRLNDDVTKKT